MENIFEGLEKNNEQVVTSVDSKSTDNKKAQLKKEMKENFKQAVNEDPTFIERLRSLSDSIEVVNTLGFGDKGNIVVDPNKPERELVATSVIVGYRIKNIGKTPIKYVTEVYAKDASGKFVGTKVEKTLAPNGIADLARQYMTVLCSIPEISFQLANGKVMGGSGTKNPKKSAKEILESYYFAFSKDENSEKKQVNSDEVKLNVGEKVGDRWVVKAEFVEAFGFLNNPKETSKGGRKSESQNFNTQDITAAYINSMIKDAGL